MIYRLELLPQIEDDLAQAFDWYEGKSRGLGEEFARTFYACVAEVARNPFLYSPAHQDFRRARLRRFPYIVFYRMVGKQTVVVYALFHGARNPAAIFRGIEDRVPEQ